MAPKEPTRAQLSSRLTYQQSKPAFLLKLQNKIAGVQDEDEDEDDEEFEYVGNGREPIPKRPRAPIPERPADDPGSADEDDDDEKPQVVVLKQGRHLTEWEAENIRRKVKGLPPLPDESEIAKPGSDPGPSSATKDTSGSTSKQASTGLSFSSSSKASFGSKFSKRKAVGQLDEEKDSHGKSQGTKKKKAKKEKKTLLSFGDDT